MKDTVKKSIKIVFSDRTVATLLIVNVVVAIVISIFLGSSIKHSEAQVITRYTTYGDANFYRSHWSSLLSYFALVFMVVFGHSVLSVKLISLEKRSLAIFLLWLTLGILAILAILAYSIIKIASIG